MRKPYEAPELVELGSLTELTQATWNGPGTDSLSWIPIIGGFLGDDGFS